MNHNSKLTTNELAALWSLYMEGSMTSCFITCFQAVNEDEEAKPIFERALSVLNDVKVGIECIYKVEGIPIPNAFSDQDINPYVERLYSDIFSLRFIQFMASGAMVSFSMAEGTAARKDIRTFFHSVYGKMAALFHDTVDFLLSKGVFVRSPIINYPDKAENIKDQSFFSSFFGKHRPLTAIEISHIAKNLETNSIGRTLIIGFSQVAKQKEVRDHLVRGKEIAEKHENLLSSMLVEDDIPSPSTWDSTVSKSITPPFSDKLMLFLIGSLNATTIGNYGLGMAASMRKDINLNYGRLLAEVGQYAEDSAKLMIRFDWMEEPPQNADRDALRRR
ncbi:DUF3231 family protein [Cytobacillus spongiae]|jgi:hypothetical protein|uniref:DUF3231 family protein n=1 Tax=Cytobacillus spongiae TaxID=2901381 RepID=UPI001F48C422|nr:DUF3231 family protein [Cytobacillus spongiae]UII57739.1 DUF3231 family protein [Cytobacillus spongiae]